MLQRLFLLCVLAAPAFAQGDPAALAARLRADRFADQETVAAAEAALRMVEESLRDDAQPDSLLLLQPLANLGRCHEILGAWGPAIEHYDRARGLAERQLAPDDLRLAWPLRDLANLLRIVNAVEPAQQMFERSLALQEARLGAEHPEVAETLRQRLRLWLNLGRMDEALVDAERALRIARASDDPALLATVLQAHARVRDERNELAAAREGFEEALRVADRAFAGDHVARADLLNDFSRHLQRVGDLARARQCLQDALAIAERHFGEEHVYVVVIRSNLAELLSKEGDFASALRLLREQLAAREAAFGPEHPRVAGLWNNIGGNQVLAGEPREALGSFENALRILRAAYGEGHESTARTLDNLAGALRELGEREAARARLLEARAILDQLGTREGELRAHNWISLAEIDLELDDPAACAEALAQCATILPSAPGLRAEWELASARLARARADAGTALAHYERCADDVAAQRGAEHPLRAEALAEASALLVSRQPAQAFAMALEAEQIARAHLQLLARGASQSDALRYAARRPRALDSALQVAFAGCSAAQLQALWSSVAQERAQVLEEMAERALIAQRSKDPQIQALRERLQSARSRLARLALGGPQGMPRAELQTLLASTRAEQDAVEERLAAQSRRFAERRQAGELHVAAARSRLPERSALISYRRHADGSRYAALVLRAGALSLVDLGAARRIEDELNAWRAELVQGALPPGPLQMAAEERLRARAAALETLLWTPLQLDDLEVVWIVPDAALHHLSFAALGGDEGYLLERGPTIQLLASERELFARPRAARVGLVAVGEVDYGNFAAPAQGAECASWAQLRFAPLPQTAQELAALDEAALRLRGGEANEQRLRAAVAERGNLHLATHGYLLADDCAQSGNPLLRCGLALAGANQHRARGGVDDGLLTGEEILSLPLDGARRVVLSACDSGSGDLARGEGLLGLRRAFALAGAQSIVSSLWSIDDESTAQLMRAFYAQEESSAAVALRAAQLEYVQTARARGSSAHPFHWAAFVASGN